MPIPRTSPAIRPLGCAKTALPPVRRRHSAGPTKSPLIHGALTGHRQPLLPRQSHTILKWQVRGNPTQALQGPRPLSLPPSLSRNSRNNITKPNEDRNTQAARDLSPPRPNSRPSRTWETLPRRRLLGQACPSADQRKHPLNRHSTRTNPMLAGPYRRQRVSWAPQRGRALFQHQSPRPIPTRHSPRHQPMR